jgi:hypothetical protein
MMMVGVLPAKWSAQIRPSDARLDQRREMLKLRGFARLVVFFNAFFFFVAEAFLGPPQSVPLPFLVDFLCTVR